MRGIGSGLSVKRLFPLDTCRRSVGVVETRPSGSTLKLDRKAGVGSVGGPYGWTCPLACGADVMVDLLESASPMYPGGTGGRGGW